MVRVKICGMRDKTNTMAIAALLPDYMGFIFYQKSPRYCGDTITPDLIAELNRNVQTVAVFVNADITDVVKTMDTFGFSIIQLHGDESPSYCSELRQCGARIIKAFHVDAQFDWTLPRCYEDMDYFMFDTRSPGYGGTGRKFDWSLLSAYDCNTPYFLSGGIGPADIENIMTAQPLPYAIDLNSGFEISPGIKDKLLISEMLKHMRK